jgi:hypothetical protein
LGTASTNLVGHAIHIARVAHLNDCLDLAQSGRAERRRSLGVALATVWTATEGIVGDLRTLRISDDDKLRVWAARIEAVHGRRDG